MKSLLVILGVVTYLGVVPPTFATTKAELIQRIAAQTGIAIEDVEVTLESLLAVITQDLAQGNTVTIVGFGTFTTRSRSARTGRNPRTGETIEIPASISPVFKAGKDLKDAVNRGNQ